VPRRQRRKIAKPSITCKQRPAPGNSAIGIGYVRAGVVALSRKQLQVFAPIRF
jgi:hypothetical protein